ncbi:Hypothetical_protein [Hexamita inflata]|uniref:Hypothetical_protein n=1 Tax=Hexamita inflata TaxID=28002 RepID=A0ABP1HDZ3_9EUKA
MESVYEEIGNLLGVYKANCTAIMYKKKVIRRDEINDHEDVIPGNQNNRFAALASDDIRIPKKIHTQQLMNTQLTQQGRRRNQMYKRRFRKSQKRQNRNGRSLRNKSQNESRIYLPSH